ncbi:MAG: NAD(P)/FAD-dependent oxidoreductase [Nitrosopumilaceae archaeon]|nr:NAD(P)/FAD-dependent oxidoreductase [Nitrosopumilaceae archaeon]
MKRIVVLGGGFAGVECVRQLQRGLRSNSTTDILLISEQNFLLFRPMLPQVASGTINTRNIVMPIRSILKKARFYEGRVRAIDPATRQVSLWGTPEMTGITVNYDYLVVALGGEPDFFGMSGIKRNAFRMQNRVMDMLEQANNEPDEGAKRALLTFVIVGGGFSGIETAGELHDLLVDATKHYPAISRDEVRVVVVESRPAILPGFAENLAKFAYKALVRRGIEMRLQSRLMSFDRSEAEVSWEGGSETIHAHTLIWTAGFTAVNMVQRSVFKTVNGKIAVNDHLEVEGYPGVFAAGDCSLLMDPKLGVPYAPTGHLAAAQGKIIAHNLSAKINGQPLKKFRYKPEYQMAVIGKRTGVALIHGIRIQGVAAWMLWRTVFLYKMPVFSKRLRVIVDWTGDLLFDRDIARLTFMNRQDEAKDYRSLDVVDEFW